MPRPPLKRLKSKAKSPQVARNLKQGEPARVELERRLSNKNVGARPVDSDDSDRLVTRSSSRRNPNALRRDIFASGGLAAKDQLSSHPNRSQRRRNLENETRQIIRENSQKPAEAISESTSPSPQRVTQSPRNSAVVTTILSSKQTPKIPSAIPQSVTKLPLATLNSSARTPLGETSILGTLKPRRRQASILHLIERGNNSNDSTINSDDEEQFLPDDESTPLSVGRQNRAELGSLPIISPISRKRKLDHGEPAQTNENIKPTTKARRHESARPRASQVRPGFSLDSAPKGDAAWLDVENDVMAPPQSSSPESTPQKPVSSASVQPQAPAHRAPTTEKLQSLMPSKRRKHSPTSDFDIPEDSSSDPKDDGDESVFNPRKRAKKPAKTKKTLAQKKDRASNKKAKSSTKSTTPAPLFTARSKPPRRAVSTLRNPLPLTNSLNGLNRKLSSPSRQGQSSSKNGASEKPFSFSGKSPRVTIEHETAVKNAKSVKERAGGCPRNIRQTRSTRRQLSGGLRGPDNSREEFPASGKASTGDRDGNGYKDLDEENVQPDIEHMNGEQDEVEIQFGRGNRYGQSPSTNELECTVDGGLKAVQSKWDDIDNWSLDYEEVDVNTSEHSSQGWR